MRQSSFFALHVSMGLVLPKSLSVSPWWSSEIEDTSAIRLSELWMDFVFVPTFVIDWVDWFVFLY
jgi:hypothetical protein